MTDGPQRRTPRATGRNSSRPRTAAETSASARASRQTKGIASPTVAVVIDPEIAADIEWDLHRFRLFSAEEFIESDPDQLHRGGIRAVVAADGELVAQACTQVLANAPHLPLTLAVLDRPVDRTALDEALDAPVEVVDALEVNGRASLGGFVIEPDALVASPATGALALLRRLFRRPSRTTVHVDGVQRGAGRIRSVVVTNTDSVRIHDHGDPIEVAPAADPSDGLVEVIVVPSSSLLDQARSWWCHLLGRPQPLELAESHRGSWVHIRCVEGRPAELDGIALVGGSGDLRVFDLHALPSAIRHHRRIGNGDVARATAEVAAVMEPDGERTVTADAGPDEAGLVDAEAED